MTEKKKESNFSEFLRQRRKARSRKDDFIPEQFELKKKPIPWKAIFYATILFLVGTALLITGSLIHTGHVDNEVSSCQNCRCTKISVIGTRRKLNVPEYNIYI